MAAAAVSTAPIDNDKLEELIRLSASQYELFVEHPPALACSREEQATKAGIDLRRVRNQGWVLDPDLAGAKRNLTEDQLQILDQRIATVDMAAVEEKADCRRERLASR